MHPNIIFVLLDGARFDRLEQSKEFTELSSYGTLLNNVTTAIPYTFGSFNVILTGKYGKENGVDGFYKVFKLKNEVPFLPEILQKNGYFTARGLISDGILSPRGFDIRREFNEFTEDLNQRHPELIEEIYKKSADRPFFLFLQFTRIHTVTVTNVLKKFEWDDKKYYKNKESNLKTYDETFKEAGEYAKKIKQTVDKLGISDNTIIIFFSDHGTGVGERFGERNYGSFTFEETIRLNEFSDAHIKQLQIAYRPLRGKRLSMDQIKKLEGMIKKMSVSQMKTVAHADIPFLASMTKTHLVLHKGMKWSDFKRPLDMSYEPEKIDEAISPDKVKAYTRSSDHFGARIYVAQQMRDKDMESIYQGLELLHRKYGSFVGNVAIQTRDKIEKLLYGKIVGKWGTKLGDDVIRNL